MSTTRNPVHVAIIMDGNGRWAEKKGLPRTAGHKAGAEILRKIVEYAASSSVEYLTCYAFSTENWKRPKLEVSFLMKLLSHYLEDEIENLKKNGIRLKIIGDKSGLSSKLQKQVEKAESLTGQGDRLQLNLAINYGGHQDLVFACRKIARKIEEKELKIESISEEMIASHLSTRGIPAPDLLIRPGGDYRISNFLLWELAYTEFFFIEKLWPDFTSEDFDEIINSFLTRERRFGGVNDSGGMNV